MKRVLLGGMKHETVTFVPGVATLDTFRRNHLVEGADVFGPVRGTGQEIDGILEVAKEEDIELIPTIDAYGAAAPVRGRCRLLSTSATASWPARAHTRARSTA